MNPEPRDAQLAGLIGARIFEAIEFDLAMAVLVVGRRLFASLATTAGRATAAQLAAAWLLGSWWPHSALHMHVGTVIGPLLAVEWAFHAGSIVAIGVLLWAVRPGLSARAEPHDKASVETSVP